MLRVNCADDVRLLQDTIRETAVSRPTDVAVFHESGAELTYEQFDAMFNQARVREFARACPEARIANIYGPTEANVITSQWLDEPGALDGDAVPIGRETDDAEIILIDDSDKLGGRGEVGELWCCGTQVAVGYGTSTIRNKPADNTCRVHSTLPLRGTGAPESLVPLLCSWECAERHSEFRYLRRLDRHTTKSLHEISVQKVMYEHDR